MTQTIKLKRTATPANAPTTVQLELGEVGINTHDGRMYIKKDNGIESIVQIGGDSNCDGGRPDSIFTAQQVLDGGAP